MADDVGSLLLRAGLVSTDQLGAARKEVTNVGGTVPEQLVQQGHISDEALTAFYRKRLLIPRVNPNDLQKISARLLEKVPSDMATEFRSIPISLDHEGNLTLVMSDPSDSEAVDEIAFFTGNYVVRAIATQAQIAWCLAHYYEQKTKLFLGLVAEGQFTGESLIEPANSKLATMEMPRLRDPDEGETGPMKTRKPVSRKALQKKARDMTRAETEDDPGSKETGERKAVTLERPSNQQPSPAELFARAGEIRSAELEVDRPIHDDGPAVVISMAPDSDGVVQQVDTGPDTAPILLTDLAKKADGEANDNPIVLTKTKRKKRRSSKRTNVGLGAVGSDGPMATGQVMAAAPHAETAPAGSGFSAEPAKRVRRATGVVDSGESPKSKKSKNTSPLASAIRASSVDLVGGDWGAPGTTIPPGYIGAVPASYDDVDSAIPEAIDDDAQTTAQMRSPFFAGSHQVSFSTDAVVTSDQPEPAAKSTPNDAATNLLLAVRALDRAEDRSGIVDAILDFLDHTYERTGFMALKQDDLVTWRLHNCSDEVSATLCVTKDSIFKKAVETLAPYNGPLSDPISKKLARDIDIPDALDLLILPISLRDRAIGVFLGMSSFGPMKDDHIVVLSQAASESFERIVLARKK